VPLFEADEATHPAVAGLEELRLGVVEFQGIAGGALCAQAHALEAQPRGDPPLLQVSSGT
jgi:hypothetical protein